MLAAQISKGSMIPLTPEQAKKAASPCAWGENEMELYQNWEASRKQYLKQQRQKANVGGKTYLHTTLERQKKMYQDAEFFQNMGY